MNPDLAKAFQLAREEIRAGRQWYICTALGDLYREGKIPGLESEQAREIIQQRLGVDDLGRWTTTVEVWLRDNVEDFAQGRYTDQDLVDYRCRWLDSLIKEFS